MTSARWQSAIVRPRTIAVVGASDDPGKVGGRPIDLMKRQGFAGMIYPVNPSRSEVQGLRCHRSVRALPETPDLAIIAVPAARVLEAVEDCAAAQVPLAIIFSSGFRETGAEGAASEAKAIAAARCAGLRILGPNCQGITNFSCGLVANFSTIFYETAPKDGPIAIVSQSGALAQVLYGAARAQGLGVRYVQATGNQADLTLTDLAEVVIDDPDIGLVLLYLESVVDPVRLAASAERARARGLPILAVKSGRTTGGRRAALSHTGAMANEDRVVDTFFRTHGIQRVDSPNELVRNARWLLERHRPGGRHLFFLSNSGASCVMACDQAEARGLALSGLSPQAAVALRQVLPAHIQPNNPLDISTLLLDRPAALSEALASIRSHVEADVGVIALPVMGMGYDLDSVADAITLHRDRCGHALAAVVTHETLQATLRSRGLAVFDNEADAIDALGALLDQAAVAGRPHAIPEASYSDVPDVPRDARHLNEAQALDLLQAAGLEVVPHRLCHDAMQVHAACRAFAAPVAIKGCSRDIAHKTELGLVSLNVSDAEAAMACFEHQRRIVRRAAARFDGVLVAPMLLGGLEMVLGGRWDPTFGAVVMIGSGGIHVETDADVALLLPPFGEDQVREAIAGLRLAPVLAGSRGRPPRDVDAVARLAVRLGDALRAWAGRVVAVDCNPVFVFEQGKGATVADAWMELSVQQGTEAAGG